MVKLNLIHFFFLLQDSAEDAGRIGLSIVLAGMFGSVACGFVLDKTHLFKLVPLPP